jgi:hypothetical protein
MFDSPILCPLGESRNNKAHPDIVSNKNKKMNTATIIRYSLLLMLTILCHNAMAQEFVHRPPIYIVNGERMSEEQVKRINPADIATNTLLPADEESVAKYGQEASNGVIVITLRYDTPAHFEFEGKQMPITDYLAEHIKWEYPANPVARVVIRLKIAPDGTATMDEVLQATDKRLLKRVTKLLTESPRWVPALKDGKGVDSEYILRLTLPQGMKLPRERSVPVVVGGL